MALGSDASNTNAMPVTQTAESGLKPAFQVNDHCFGWPKRYQPRVVELGSTCVCRRAGCVVYFREVFCSKSRNVCNLRGIRQQQEVLVFWKTHVFGSVFLGSVFAKVSQIPCFCCFFKWKLRGDFQVVVLKAAKTRGFCMVDLCKVKQQASGNDHPNDCDSSNISHRPPPPTPTHHCTAPPKFLHV